VKQKLIRDNAMELFRLGTAASGEAPAETLSMEPVVV
jgi:hypothetical protein